MKPVIIEHAINVQKESGKESYPLLVTVVYIPLNGYKSYPFNREIVSIKHYGVELLGLLELTGGIDNADPFIRDLIWPGMETNEELIKEMIAGKIEGATVKPAKIVTSSFPIVENITTIPTKINLQVGSIVHLFTVDGIGEFTAKSVQCVLMDGIELFNSQFAEYPKNAIAEDAIIQAHDDTPTPEEFKKAIKGKSQLRSISEAVNLPDLKAGLYTLAMKDGSMVQFEVMESADDKLTGCRDRSSDVETIDISLIREIYKIIPSTVKA